MLCDFLFDVYSSPKVVLLIDDLEKLPRQRALRVLQAVQLLVSQRPSDNAAASSCPFKVVIALDPCAFVETVDGVGGGVGRGGASSAAAAVAAAQAVTYEGHGHAFLDANTLPSARNAHA